VKWFNEHQTIHDAPVPKVTTNGLLFTAIYHLLVWLNTGSIDRNSIIICLNAHKQPDGSFRNTPGSPDEHMSA
jgi:hypothetical protein